MPDAVRRCLVPRLLARSRNCCYACFTDEQTGAKRFDRRFNKWRQPGLTPSLPPSSWLPFSPLTLVFSEFLWGRAGGTGEVRNQSGGWWWDSEPGFWHWAVFPQGSCADLILCPEGLPSVLLGDAADRYRAVHHPAWGGGRAGSRTLGLPPPVPWVALPCLCLLNDGFGPFQSDILLWDFPGGGREG